MTYEAVEKVSMNYRDGIFPSAGGELTYIDTPLDRRFYFSIAHISTWD